MYLNFNYGKREKADVPENKKLFLAHLGDEADYGNVLSCLLGEICSLTELTLFRELEAPAGSYLARGSCWFPCSDICAVPLCHGRP